MLELIDLMKFEVIVAPELGVASSHGVGGFQQVVAKVAVAGFNQSCILCYKVTGLVLRPDKSCVLGNRSLRFKAADIADLGDDTGRINRTDTWDRGQGIGDDFELLLNGFFQHLEMALQRPHRGNGYRHSLINGVIDSLGEPVGTSGSGLHSLSCCFKSANRPRPAAETKAVRVSRSQFASSSTDSKASIKAKVVALVLGMALSCAIPEHLRNR